ncbi:sigma-70 family RNA polymerase sigma factor [Amycolatopsis sp. Hca4]|uniref:sigma-70 family RNA polymerase sigma factor n=1 Tax=Amycolatopsis sp. Hca4 TaxID=2742131 RepID=UPI001591D524|nr:sigma-70 family RNA polymerase sigma factor [Amycolatopsis sp. Hca4]QKV76237.1 sigma-70 family RNA polymerase sigma factor [Amycolatopsis sp. Hca4]
MSTVPADLSGKSDAELIAEVRSGKIKSYGTLYERHTGAAHNLARQLARSSSEADDLVSEAFAKVLDTLRNGKGPDTAFRAYLLTALRHTAYDRTRKERRVDLNEDMTEVGGAAAEALTVPFSDTAVAGLERTMAAKAFARLPERWQAVLWHTEIEQQSPAEVAPLLGLTANGVSALAYRAREGLRQAYLQVHLQENAEERCRACAERLGAWTRDGLSKRERAQVESHLDECDRCRALAAELADVNGGLRAIIAPIVLGGAALGYLATIGAAKASAATAAATGAAAAGAAAAGGKAGAAGSAAAAGPRQFAGVAASGTAIVAAVIIALTAGGGVQEVPVAAPVPAPVQPAQPPAPKPQPPAPPAPPQQQQPPAPEPPAPPAPPAAPPVEPAQPPVAPPAPPPAPVPPAPAPPSMSATTPPDGLELSPGTATNLPITVRNDGGSPSDPVAVALNLPRGVRAVDTGGGGAPLARADAPGPVSVNCPGGTGKVTCKTGAGLQPGQSATLNFRLQADEDAEGGTVTGSVTAGVQISVAVSVKVTVKLPKDDMVLEAQGDGLSAFPWNHHPLVYVRVRNTGETTRPVTVTFDHPLKQWWSLRGFPCTTTDDGATCTTKSAVAPGQHVNLWVRLKGRPDDGRVTITAELGRATAPPVTVDFGCWRHWCGKDPQPPTSTTTAPTSSKPSKPKPTPSKPSSAPPVTTTEEPTLEPPVATTTTSAPPRSGGKPGAKPPTVSPEKAFGWLTG